MFESAKTAMWYRCLLSFFTLLLLASVVSAGFSPAPDPVSAQGAGDSSSTGEALFVGAIRLTNGGPPCRICHSVAGIPFPNGGTLGPDLTAS